MTRHSKGIAWQGDGQQRKGIDKLCMARAMRRMGMKRDAEEKQGKQCIAEQSEGRAKKCGASPGQSIEKLCFARAEDFSYKGAGERAEQWGKKKSATWTACTACIRIASTSGR